MVAFGIGQSEQALFQDWVISIPKHQRKTEQLLVVADAAHAVLAPPIGAAPCHIVGEVVPGIPVAAVIFPYRPPLPFAQIRPPLLPVELPRLAFFQAAMLSRGV